MRVGLGYQALALDEGDDFMWVWIGTHDEGSLMDLQDAMHNYLDCLVATRSMLEHTLRAYGGDLAALSNCARQLAIQPLKNQLCLSQQVTHSAEISMTSLVQFEKTLPRYVTDPSSLTVLGPLASTITPPLPVSRSKFKKQPNS